MHPRCNFSIPPRGAIVNPETAESCPAFVPLFADRGVFVGEGKKILSRFCPARFGTCTKHEIYVFYSVLLRFLRLYGILYGEVKDGTYQRTIHQTPARRARADAAFLCGTDIRLEVFRVPLGEGALIFGMVYNYIPFMIYPIYNTLVKMDRSYIEAAQDLGATPFQVFTKTILPLSMPGVASGILMVFMPTISTFAIAELLTMNNIKLFGTTIQENINNSMWNYGAALSLIMLFLIGAATLFASDDNQEKEGGAIW